MSVLPVGFGSSGGLQITNSVRLRAAASAYFSRTFGTPTTQNTFTFSCWMKRGALGAGRSIFSTSTGSEDFYFNPSDQLIMWKVGTVATSTAVFRDPTAHLHFVIKADGSTVKCYINNAEVCSYTGVMAEINTAIAHRIGSDGLYYFDGYLSDVYFIDGQALTPSSFGETNSDGVWVPKVYTGTYGTNGFHLDFKDAALTAGSNAGLGKDVSGNGNYWTTNNISVTAGVTYDSMVDTPTNNYATLNPIDNGGNTLSAANMTCSTPAGSYPTTRASFGMSSGKWYWETYITSVGGGGSSLYVGVAKNEHSLATWLGNTSTSWSYDAQGKKNNNSSAVAYGATYTAGNLIGVAFDADVGTLTFYKDNTSQGTAYTGLTSGPYFPALSDASSSYFATFDINFGQRPFSYTPPTGFKALCTANLPAVAIMNPSLHHQVLTVTKSGNTNFTIPWNADTYDTLFLIKRRDSAGSWYQIDGLRGYTKVIFTNSTGAETTDANVLGVAGTVGTLKSTLTDGTYVVEMWKAGLTASRQTNTDGSITSTVSRNVTAGFSIVTFTGTGADATIGHGLGVTPKRMVQKNLTDAVTWIIAHDYSAFTWASDYFMFDDQAKRTGGASQIWRIAPTSSVFAVGSNATMNGSGKSIVVYCHADVAGYSKFGSYVGNASADGTFAFTNLRPASVVMKSVGTINSWTAVDDARSPYNLAVNYLLPDLSNAEGSTTAVDLNAIGIKHRGGGAFTNGSDTYIYSAYARHPFGGSNCSPSPAR